MHSRVISLLPWYANGTLAPAERALVDQHLSGCADCRVALDQYRELDTSCPQLTDQTDWQASPAHFAQILQNLDALSRQTAQNIKPDLSSRIVNWLKATPRPVVWMLSLESVALATVLILLVTPRIAQSPAETQMFATLSNVRPHTAEEGQARIHIVFAEDISEREIHALLATVHARLVDGPSALGVYILAVTPDKNNPLQRVLSTLRRHPKVKLAEPLTETLHP